MAEDAKRDWVQRVLGLDVGIAGSDLDAVRKRLERLEPDYLRTLGTNPPTRTALTATMAFAGEQLDAGNAVRANAALDRLEKLMAAPGDSAAAQARPTVRASGQSLYETVRGDGRLVIYRKALLDWERARKEAQGEIDGLKKTIAAAHPLLAKAADVLDGVMARLNDDLSNAIDAAMSAEGMSERTRAHATAADMARAYLMRVNFDPVFRAIDRNPVARLRVGGILGDALKSLVAAMPA